MPGETKETFMEGVDKLIETGVSRVAAHQLMLLHGAPLADPESREKFGFKTRFRVVARCLGKYLGPAVIETEEMVVESENFSFQDYLDTRTFHLLLTIYYYEDNFREIFELARHANVRPFLVVKKMLGDLNRAPEKMRQMIADYLDENQAELFPSRQACLDWAEGRYDDLINGDLGGNLLSKYSMTGRYIILKESLEFLKNTVDELLEDAGADTDSIGMMESIFEYYNCVMLHVPFSESLESTPNWNTDYNVIDWRDAGYDADLAAYKFANSKRFTTLIDPRTKGTLTSRIETFGEHASGLGRFTRTMFATDFRRKVSESPHPE
jgi:hypothetical protein